MHKRTLKNRIKRRHIGLFYLIFITIILFFIAIILFLVVNRNSISENGWTNLLLEGFLLEVVTLIISALISTTIAIYMTKDDIMDNDYLEKKDDFGVLTFENGYNKIFENDDSQEYLSVSNLEQFFRGANDHKICIVCSHLIDFFEREQYRKCLLYLCLENKYSVEIVLANPYSDETYRESQLCDSTETDNIGNKIIKIYQLFLKDINNIDNEYNTNFLDSELKPSKTINQYFKIHFSDTFPKATIFKSGANMIISPCVNNNCNDTPTLIVEKSKNYSFYESYSRYIEMLIDKSLEYSLLTKHVSSNSFFNQNYRSLSAEFYDDLASCTSLKILGLGQNHMLTHLDPQLKSLLRNGVNIEVVLTKPDGASTEMCVKRSILHNNVSEAAIEHKIAINKLLKLKNISNNGNVKIYTWDCFFPFTMYAFNSENKHRVKIYIWITNLFESAEKRNGFIINGLSDPELVKSYLYQFEEVKKHAEEIISPFIL